MNDQQRERDREAGELEAGEGDRESARRYNREAEEFVSSERGEEALEELRKEAAGEPAGDGLTEAEREARRRVKEQDPQVHRDYERPTRDTEN